MNIKSLEGEDFIIRVSPNGTCSRGKEALRESLHAPVWNQHEDPIRFLKRILANVGKQIQTK